MEEWVLSKSQHNLVLFVYLSWRHVPAFALAHPQVTRYMLFYFEETIQCSHKIRYKACPSESGTEVGAPLFPAVELCNISGRWQCMSEEIWYTLDSGSVLLTEAEAR
jgi:hypothetical protein